MGVGGPLLSTLTCVARVLIASLIAASSAAAFEKLLRYGGSETP
jgi:hypothetical protein